MNDNTGAESPLVVKLGRKSRKEIKSLRRGEGPLMDEVLALLDRLRAEGHLPAGTTPVVMVVKQKPPQSMFRFF